LAQQAGSLSGQVEQGLAQLAGELPRTMSGFGRMHQAAMADGELPTAIKELIAIAISIATGCSGCIAYHTNHAIAAGATAEQVREAVGVAIVMGGGPATVYGAEALETLRAATS